MNKQTSEELGYPKDKFPYLKTDAYDCSICQQLARDPRQCAGCGRIYCNQCLKNFEKNIGFVQCLQCEGQRFQQLGQNLIEPYNQFQMLCKCNQLVPLGSISMHKCSFKNLDKCQNHAICGQYVSEHMKKQKVCETSCLLLSQVIKHEKNPEKMHSEIKTILSDMKMGVLFNGRVQALPQQQINLQKNNNTPLGKQLSIPPGGALSWSGTDKGQNVILTSQNQTCYLKEQAYVFKTVLTSEPFMGGVHYWEIIPDQRTENEMKIGVSRGKNFSMEQAFCDFNHGFAFYGLASLRNGSNSQGNQYGKKFKNKGVLGIYLNMNKGQLAFSLDGQYFGPGFQDKQLQKGPIYPAVALLHHAGATIRTCSSIPACFN